MATFSQVYLLSLPWRWCSLYSLATASRRGLIPAVGPYSRAAMEMSMEVGRGKQPAMSSSTSGAPWPRLAQASGSSRKPYSDARSVHQTTPVDERLASSPACGWWPSWALRNWRWTLDCSSAEGDGRQLLLSILYHMAYSAYMRRGAETPRDQRSRCTAAGSERAAGEGLLLVSVLVWGSCWSGRVAVMEQSAAGCLCLSLRPRHCCTTRLDGTGIRIPQDSDKTEAVLPFCEGSLVLDRRANGLGTPVWRLMENLRPLNMMAMFLEVTSELKRGCDSFYSR